MQQNQFPCPNHPNSFISFFCTANQWHFIPLCTQCIPSHTQHHPKNFKISLETSTKVQEKINGENQSAIKQYQNRLKIIQNYLISQKKMTIYDTLSNTKNTIISIVNNYFDHIHKLLDERIAETVKFQKQLLSKLKNNIEADISDLENSDHIKQVQQWANLAKRLYFKDGITPYLDQIDEILKDHTQRVFQRNDISPINSTTLQKQLNQILTNHIALSKQTSQDKGKLPTTKEKKKIPKQKSIVCKNCGTDMQYLTQLKKHLYCPNCGGKERNYCSRKV